MTQLQYARDKFDLDDFVNRTDTTVSEDEFRTVATLEPEEGETFLIGQGSSTNPLQAEGFAEGELVDVSSGSELKGKFRLQILNTQNNPANGGMLFKNRISRLSQTNANGGDGIAVPYIDKETADPFKIALRVKLDSGTAEVDLAASTFEIDGFSGEVLG
jgi:hypothetical protein